MFFMHFLISRSQAVTEMYGHPLRDLIPRYTFIFSLVLRHGDACLSNNCQHVITMESVICW